MKRYITMGALMAALAAGTLQAQASSGASTGAGTSTNSGINAGANVGGSTNSGRGDVDVGVNMDAGVNGNSSASGNTSNRMPAVATPDSTNSKAPVAGRNSFTQSQVMTRLSRAGYTNISNLQKGSDGIWRGTGAKDGTTHNLTFDYQGNIGTGVTGAR
jgi:hypothetical protein